MEKKRIENENEQKNVVTEDVTNVVTEVTEVATKEKLYLKRTQNRGNDGKLYWNYFLDGKLKTPAGERDLQINFEPKDSGGYEILDILWEFGLPVELLVSKAYMTDNKTGRKSEYTTYTAKVIFNDAVYSCSLKARRESDKSRLEFYLNQLRG